MPTSRPRCWRSSVAAPEAHPPGGPCRHAANDPVAQQLLQATGPAKFAYTWTDGTPRVVPIAPVAATSQPAVALMPHRINHRLGNHQKCEGDDDGCWQAEAAHGARSHKRCESETAGAGVGPDARRDRLTRWAFWSHSVLR